MVNKDINNRISEIKTIIHYLSINNVNTLSKKEFDILREIETKLTQLLNEKEN